MRSWVFQVMWMGIEVSWNRTVKHSVWRWSYYTPASYSGGSQFKSCPEDRLIDCVFSWFSSFYPDTLGASSQTGPLSLPSTSFSSLFTNNSVIGRYLASATDRILNEFKYINKQQHDALPGGRCYSVHTGAWVCTCPCLCGAVRQNVKTCSKLQLVEWNWTSVVTP